jgi:hypothetical protein
VPIATAAVHPSGEPCSIYLGRPSRRRSDGLTRWSTRIGIVQSDTAVWRDPYYLWNSNFD